MQRPDRWLWTIMLVAATTTIGAANAQTLWKYTDKDGKVTYSDKPPKKGETAQLVPNDPSSNVMDAPSNVRRGERGERSERKEQRGESRPSERNNQRENQAEKSRNNVEAAKEQLEAAKTALEKGRDPLPDEVQIVVGRTPTGAPTGANSLMRKPEYYARIAALEDAVKQAQAKVELAEQDASRNAR